MLGTRVIPTLLIRNAGLVKGVNFAKHRYVGDPINAVRIFNEKEVDEIVFFDIDATAKGQSPNFSLIADIASEAFMPFGYGGGLGSLSDIEKLFTVGAEKAILNTRAVEDQSFVQEASRVAGSQSIVVSIDVKRSVLGKYSVYTHSGQRNTRMNPVEVAKRMEDAGAGEIILTSIDREGTGGGYDLVLIESITRQLNIPVIACGGAAKLEDFRAAVDAGSSSVGAGDMFIFHGKHKAVLITYPQYSKLEKLFERAEDAK